MGFEILFTDEHREKVKKRHGEQVLEGLEKRLEKKQSELDLVSRRDQAGNRFYNIFGHSGVTIAEISFQSERREHRGFLILVARAEAFVFYRVAEKGGHYESSEQRKVIGSIEENPEQVMDYARDVVVEEMDY